MQAFAAAGRPDVIAMMAKGEPSRQRIPRHSDFSALSLARRATTTRSA